MSSDNLNSESVSSDDALVGLVHDDDYFKTWLNNIIRAADRPNVGQDIVQPMQHLPIERDHFFEIQHIVNLIMEDDDWMQTPIGQYLDLISFVNDGRNIFRIARSLNQAKGRIPFNAYRNNVQIAGYLRFNVQNGTVEGQVRSLAYEMATRRGANADLTRRIGGRIRQIMGWH